MFNDDEGAITRSAAYLATMARAILEANNVPSHTGNWADYEYGKLLLGSYDLYDIPAIKVLAEWVGVRNG
jgi:hypothetical protein